MFLWELVKLTRFIEHTSGSPEGKTGLIDGFVVTQQSDLEGEYLREILENNSVMCALAKSLAGLHGIFAVGIVSAKRSSVTLANNWSLEDSLYFFDLFNCLSGRIILAVSGLCGLRQASDRRLILTE